ncbi:MAG: FAD-binding oxidoreductase [Casimicrobiaceae bacterium]
MSSPAEHAPSLWSVTAIPDRDWPALAGDERTDVAIIGGGFTGCAAALALAEHGVRVTLLEANRIGWGASGRNGGQVIPGLKDDPDHLEAMFGPELGPRVAAAAGGVADEVFGLIARHAIACDPVRNGWLQPAFSARTLDVVTARCAQWARRGAPVRALDRREMAHLIGSDAYHGGWEDQRAGNVQPLSYVRGLAAAAHRAGARLCVGTPVTALRRHGTMWNLATPGGEVTADKVLIGTNGYTDRLWPGLARTVIPMMSFQAATVPLSAELGASILPGGHSASDTRRLLWYYRRDAHGRLVMGGRAPFRENLGPADAGHLRAAVDRLYPQLRGIPFEFYWSGRVAMTPDYLPHLHELAPGVWAGLGYNGRGVGMATLLGRLLAELARGARPADIPFPITAMRPIPGYPFTRIVARALVRYYRVRDNLEAA